MHCDVVRVRGGYAVVVCGRRAPQPPCYRCHRPARIQCDRIVGHRDTGVALIGTTCDRWCCSDSSCSVAVGPNKDFCRACFDALPAAERAALQPQQPRTGGTTP